MNFSNFEYLIVLILVLIVPLLFSFFKKSYIYGNRKNALKAILTVAPFWVIYDIWATSRGHWSFNYDFTFSFRLINLPLEEVLFFLVVPFSCLFVWTIISDFSNFKDFLNRLSLKK